MNHHDVPTKQLTYAGAAIAAGGVAVTCATATSRRELLRDLARITVVIGTGIVVAAQARRPNLTAKHHFEQGYEAGHYDGRRIGRPVLVHLPRHSERTTYLHP